MRRAMRRVRGGPSRAMLAGLALLLATASCSGTEPGPGATPGAAPGAAPSAPTSTATLAGPAPEATRTSIGVVAGRLGAAKRQRIKKVATDIVEGYVDGAYAGSYPRTDFSAAFADFGAKTRRDARRDLSLLTNVDLGTRVSSVTPTRRRLRVDVLAPRGRPSGATARFVLDFDTTGEVTRSMRVSGSLLLSNQRGAWKVFGYDVRRPRVRA